MTLPWIVILMALGFYVLWKSGLMESQGRRRPPAARRRQIPGKAEQDSDRLKVFEEFLGALHDDDRPEKRGDDQDGGKT